MQSILATKVMMVRPLSFRSNEETAATNAFQAINGQNITQSAQHARDEFECLRQKLIANGIQVTVYDEPETANTPDALFPNNWFAILPEGDTFLFPMQAANRQREVQPEWLAPFAKGKPMIDLRNHIKENKFLEGTGSLILDHKMKLGYACLSQRTNPDVIADFSKKSGYTIVTFTAHDSGGTPFYHTNVMMALGTNTAIICSESIKNADERSKALAALERSGKKVSEITLDQVSNFCGNLLQLKSLDGERYWVCSERAFKAFTPAQRSELEKDAKFIHAPLPTIETLGGGSARCMLGEIY